MKSSSETIVSGSKANKTGSSLERFVQELLLAHGYSEITTDRKQLFANRAAIGGKQFAQQVPIGKNIYEKERTVDFLIINYELFEDSLIVECKWQQASGSVDEKYPFLYFNIMKAGVPTVVLLDGGGYSQHANEWLRSMADPNRALMHVWNMAEFQKKANNGFLG